MKLRIFARGFGRYSYRRGDNNTFKLLATMSKEKSRHRMNRLDPGVEASVVFFQVICPGLPGFSGSLFLSTSNRRYLFNCGEGTQRLTVEHCVSRSLASLQHIFLTRKSWRAMGGLGGMCLAIKGSGSPDVNLHGPKGSMDIYGMTKGFISLTDFDVIPSELSEDEKVNKVYRDSTLSIRSVSLLPTEADQPSSECPPYWDTTYKSYDKNGKILSDFVPEVLNLGVPPERKGLSISYIIEIKGRKGKLNLEKCLEMGVPPGPLLGKLKNGQDISLENGNVIRSADVKDEDLNNQSYIVVDLPDTKYIDALLKAPEWEDLKKNGTLAGIFHFTPSATLHSPKYLEWMESFGENVVQHMVNDLNPGGYGTLGTTTLTEKLNILDPKLFKSLHSDTYFNDDDLTHNKKTWIYHRTADRIVVRGSPPELETTLPVNQHSLVKAEMMSIPNLDDLIKNIEESSGGSENDEPYPRFTFLGTGSSIPSKYRGPSAILVELRKSQYMIMDCGEGTTVQIYRYFGLEEGREVLRNLKCVYISHLHADHHMGLIGLIQERRSLKGSVPPLFIAGPTKLASFLNKYHYSFEPILENIIQIKNEHALLLPKNIRESSDFLLDMNNEAETHKRFKEYVGLSLFATCRAHHCVNSFCSSFLTKEGFHFLYTGDTRPTPALIELASYVKTEEGEDKKNSPNLLIHEATMEQYLLPDAVKKKHSTITEAINGGIAMNAKNTILTHFSQRYPKFPVFDEIRDHPNVGFATDFMTVSPGNLSHSFHLMDALNAVFKDDFDLMSGRKELFEYRTMQAASENNKEVADDETVNNILSKLDRPTAKRKRLTIDE